jgi:tetratricopeptide (TPR) repeat protein
VIAALFPVLLGLAAPAGHAPAGEVPVQAPRNEIEDLYYAGAADYSASEYRAAIDKFTRALALAVREDSDPHIRVALLFNLAQAHAGAFEVDRDVRHLRQAVDIYRRFLDESEPLGQDAEDQRDAAREAIARIEAELPALEADAAHDDKARPDVEPEPAAHRVDPGRRRRGIVLAVGGGVALLGGVGLLAFGTTFRRDAERVVATHDDPPEVEEAFVREEVRKGRVWIGVGAGVAAVGAGLLTWGIVDLVASRSGPRAVAVVPTLGPVNGLGLSARF